ncbi:MAG: WYL domain-containing protein, partial [Pseudomonadota bacterium]
VSQRTVYRDIAALQAMGTPIDGESGIGYAMRRGYDLPPLNFDREEIEALHVGLSMLSRTGDSTLQAAAKRICVKIDALQEDADWLQVAPYGAPKDDPVTGCISIAALRDAVRQERKLRLTYLNTANEQTTRTVRPLAIVYHIDSTLLAAWCELRGGFRHFRVDQLYCIEVLDEWFCHQGPTLRALWAEQNRWRESEPAVGIDPQKEQRPADEA